MIEEVLGLIGNTEGRGKGRAMRRYALVFTSNRVIVAKTAGALGIALKAGLGAAFGGPAGGYEAVKKHDKKMSKKSAKIVGLPAKEILEADKLNYAIPYSDIVKVEMKRGGFLSSPKIVISTTHKKHTFRIVEKKAFNGYLELVRSMLPNKVA